MNDRPFYESPVMPVQYEQDHVFNFRCYKGIDCFNACCNCIDITLTPYDILRMKRRLGMTSGEFLKKHTVPFQLDKDGLPGVKFRTADDAPRCLFVTDEGCSIYEDRPTACRYYPLGLLSFRHAEEYQEHDKYAKVVEEHCLGHNEERAISIADYRQEQGVEIYDEMAAGWRRLLLKKRSLGPAIGKPSERSMRLFFLASYDLDAFRAFVSNEDFQRGFDLEADYWQRLMDEDEELLLFGQRLLLQVLFGDQTLPIRQGAAEERLAQHRAKLAADGDQDVVVDANYDDTEGA